MAWSFRLPSCLPICPNSPLAASKGARARACFCLHARARAIWKAYWQLSEQRPLRSATPKNFSSIQRGKLDSWLQAGKAVERALARFAILLARARTACAFALGKRAQPIYCNHEEFGSMNCALQPICDWKNIKDIIKSFWLNLWVLFKKLKVIKCLSEEVFFQVV